MQSRIIKITAVTAILAFLVFMIMDKNIFNNGTENEKFGIGNGRLEATQINISSKIPGRLLEVYVQEGDMVEKGQVLAKLDTDELEARLKSAQAYVQQMKQNKLYEEAIVLQRESELTLAKKTYDRTLKLYNNKSIALAQLDHDTATLEAAKATLQAQKAKVINQEAAINAAIAQVDTIKVNINDSTLYSPVKGRVLYKLAENGEVVASGGNVLTVLNLLDTYMTIFLPTSKAGLVNIGSPARIIFDALPGVAVPANVTFISPQAQFTPKEIETQTEREKLMFRIKVKIDPKLLKDHIQKIKTGVPGVVYIKLDENAQWPEKLSRLPKE
jgi:HlyD family secretion protein